jgi:hypothetical protein
VKKALKKEIYTDIFECVFLVMFGKGFWLIKQEWGAVWVQKGAKPSKL